MLHKFKKHLSEIEDANPSNTYLLAVSGGMDSIAMVDLFAKAMLKFGVAHCNFKLRGDESDQDEIFVQQIASSHKAPFFGKSFKTKSYAEQTGVSIQEAARALRYRWLRTIMVKEGYSYICTAHHVNDSIETILLNLVRGTGIRGIAGIPNRNRKILRPLNFASKYEIAGYLKKNELTYRKDSSNEELKYTRNAIRKEIIPILTKLNPALEETFKKNLKLLNAGKQIYLSAIEEAHGKLIKVDETPVRIKKSSLLEETGMVAVLFEYIRKLGFNADQNEQILRSIESTGKQFHSATHRIIIDREEIIIHELQDHQDLRYEIEEGVSTFAAPNSTFEFRKISGGIEAINRDPDQAFLDLEKIQFPLVLRKWMAGDIFLPLGLSGKTQKVSDFFINNKLSLYDKETAWILQSGSDICWISGQRISESFKITDQTKEILHITWNRNEN